ncbi:MAG: type II secretion system F family protein [Candidatus Paceibacterota bacterium]|nr:MAG: type II secretion system F family protein [Candidatus Paceibacterota bacterium]
MLFKYHAIDNSGAEKEGIIDALNKDVAISSLQNRGLVVSSVELLEKPSILRKIPFLNRVASKDIVIVTRQMATLFEAQVSALRVFRLLSSETDHPVLKRSLGQVADDLQEGSSISAALEKHPHIFSDFYVSMVKVGEESGRLSQVFVYLADYLDRTYAVTTKAKHALIYPTFVIIAFIGVMVLLFTVVIPRITPILLETGVDLPVYTKAVLWMSSFLLNYGIYLLVALIIMTFVFFKYFRTQSGRLTLDNLKLSVPYVSNLYQKLYLTRIADNMNTMTSSGVSMIQAIESTAEVVDNEIFKEILQDAALKVKAGKSLSSALAEYREVPSIMTQMIKVGEETGELAHILDTLAKFYQREVITAVDTLTDMIQPAIIVVLGLGVGFLLAAVLMPIYNIAGAF